MPPSARSRTSGAGTTGRAPTTVTAEPSTAPAPGAAAAAVRVDMAVVRGSRRRRTAQPAG
jgi:hypothetical protein